MSEFWHGYWYGIGFVVAIELLGIVWTLWIIR